LVVAAVEKVPAPKNNRGKHGHAVKRQHGFVAGGARIAVLPTATGAELGAFLKPVFYSARPQLPEIAAIIQRARCL
jgi:hypothetical protein